MIDKGAGHDGNRCGHHPEWCDDAGTCWHPDPLHELGSHDGEMCLSCGVDW